MTAATPPHPAYFVAVGITPAPTELSEAEKASDRYHIAEMARINGTASDTSESPFLDYIILPLGFILFAIVILRQMFSFD